MWRSELFVDQLYRGWMSKTNDIPMIIWGVKSNIFRRQLLVPKEMIEKLKVQLKQDIMFKKVTPFYYDDILNAKVKSIEQLQKLLPIVECNLQKSKEMQRLRNILRPSLVHEHYEVLKQFKSKLDDLRGDLMKYAASAFPDAARRITRH